MSFSPETFLLDSELARDLYHEVAHTLPIHDYVTLFGYRSALMQAGGPPLVQHWLGADLRLNLALQRQGLVLSEAATDQAAFGQWAAGLGQMAGSPWHLEAQLALYHSFGVREWLSADTVADIWPQVQAGLAEDGYSPQRLPVGGALAQVHTFYDPAQPDQEPLISFPAHLPVKAHPAFCPDQVLALGQPNRWNSYLNRLREPTDATLDHFIDLLDLLQQRVDQLAARGCRLAVHHLGDPGGVAYTDEEVNFLFHKLRLGHGLEPVEQAKIRSALLFHLLGMYHHHHWALYLVLGVHPADEGSPLPHLLDDQPLLQRLFWQMDRWDQAGILPKVILNLPGHRDLAAHLVGHYPKALMRMGLDLSLPQGPAALGRQFDALRDVGLLGDGIGLGSGAAHPLALVRHDYGRRVLCSWLAQQVATGVLPADRPWLEQVLRTWGHEGVQAWLG